MAGAVGRGQFAGLMHLEILIFDISANSFAIPQSPPSRPFSTGERFQHPDPQPVDRYRTVYVNTGRQCRPLFSHWVIHQWN